MIVDYRNLYTTSALTRHSGLNLKLILLESIPDEVTYTASITKVERGLITQLHDHITAYVDRSLSGL